MSSLNICPEAAVERGRGLRSNASPPHDIFSGFVDISFKDDVTIILHFSVFP